MDQQSPSQTSQPRYAWTQQPQQNGPSDMFVPPAKRARLSPNPASPLAQSPQSPFSAPGNFSPVVSPNGLPVERQSNGLSEPGSMGPPQRPDKAPKLFDVNDLSDLVTSSGIDLRQEEDYLATTYRNERSFNTQSSQSFSPQNSFEHLSQVSFENFGAGHGSFSQQQPRRTVEDELFDRHKKAARDAAERQQHHLNSPFLTGAGLRRFADTISNDNGVKLPMEGLFDRINKEEPPGQPRRVHMQGADGTSITALTAPSILNANVPLEGIFTLLSLAANERLRSLLEDAYALARGRQSSADGVVAPEWSDLATGNNPQISTAKPVAITRSPWDAQPEASGEPNALPSPPNSVPDAAQPVQTVSFPKKNSLTNALATLSRQDRQDEEARLRKRAERRAKKAAAEGTQSGDASTPLSTPAGPTTPQPLAERAPEPKMSKKERERLAKQDITDEAATKSANTTAAMQLKGKQYSWMKTASSTPAKPALGSRTTSSTPQTGGAGPAAGTVAGLSAVKDRRFGDWREDGVGGRGIQLRDWVNVLEQDGKERKTLAYAYARLGREREHERPTDGPPTPGVPATPAAPSTTGATAGTT